LSPRRSLVLLACLWLLASPAQADVTFDSFSCYNAASPCTTPGPTGDFSWTVTPVGTPRAAQCFVVADVGAGTPGDEVVGITYGGAAMGEMAGSPLLVDQATDNGSIYGYFLDNVAAGAQTVAVDVDATGSEKTAFCATMTSAGPALELVDVDTAQGNSATPAVTLSLGSRTSFALVVGFSGQAGQAPNLAPNANWTEQPTTDGGVDFGPANSFAAIYDVIGTTDVVAGYANGSTPDYGLMATAVAEAAAAATGQPSALLLGGVSR